MPGERESECQNRLTAAAGEIQSRPDGSPIRNPHGLTLLELLLVVLILSAIALMTISFTESTDKQFRFEDTRTRLENIRAAVAGDPLRVLNGESAISGFAADMGRLPDCLQELVEGQSLMVPPCQFTTDESHSFDTKTGLWSGWNGPYLASLTEQSSGTRAFRDGWGNAGNAASHYGWKTFSAADLDGGSPNQIKDTLTVQTFGADGTAGGTGYDADYPASGVLVERADHQLNLKGWNSITLILDNSNNGSNVNVLAGTLRLRVYYPLDGSFSWTDSTQPGFSWPASRDPQPYLSLVFPAANQTVPAGGTLTLPNPVDLGSVSNKWIPWGVRSLGVINDTDGSVYQPGAVSSSPQIIQFVPRTQLPAVTVTWHVD